MQLALNVLWSYLFFGLKRPGLAFAEIIVLWIAIAAMAIAFWGKSAVASLLLTPYLAWTTFAALTLMPVPSPTPSTLFAWPNSSNSESPISGHCVATNL